MSLRTLSAKNKRTRAIVRQTEVRPVNSGRPKSASMAAKDKFRVAGHLQEPLKPNIRVTGEPAIWATIALNGARPLSSRPVGFPKGSVAYYMLETKRTML